MDKHIGFVPISVQTIVQAYTSTQLQSLLKKFYQRTKEFVYPFNESRYLTRPRWVNFMEMPAPMRQALQKKKQAKKIFPRRHFSYTRSKKSYDTLSKIMFGGLLAGAFHRSMRTVNEVENENEGLTSNPVTTLQTLHTNEVSEAPNSVSDPTNSHENFRNNYIAGGTNMSSIEQFGYSCYPDWDTQQQYLKNAVEHRIEKLN